MFYLFLFVNSIVNVPFLTILLYCNENFIVVILDPFYYGFFNPIKYGFSNKKTYYDNKSKLNTINFLRRV